MSTEKNIDIDLDFRLGGGPFFGMSVNCASYWILSAFTYVQLDGVALAVYLAECEERLIHAPLRAVMLAPDEETIIGTNVGYDEDAQGQMRIVLPEFLADWAVSLGNFVQHRLINGAYPDSDKNDVMHHILSWFTGIMSRFVLTANQPNELYAPFAGGNSAKFGGEEGFDPELHVGPAAAVAFVQLWTALCSSISVRPEDFTGDFDSDTDKWMADAIQMAASMTFPLAVELAGQIAPEAGMTQAELLQSASVGNHHLGLVADPKQAQLVLRVAHDYFTDSDSFYSTLSGESFSAIHDLVEEAAVPDWLAAIRMDQDLAETPESVLEALGVLADSLDVDGTWIDDENSSQNEQ